MFRLNLVRLLIWPSHSLANNSRSIALRPWHIQAFSKKQTNRLIDRFNEHFYQKYSSPTSPTIATKLYDDFLDNKSLAELPFNQLLTLIQSSTTQSENIQFTRKILTALDIESSRRIPDLNNNELLELIGTFHKILPEMFIRLECYFPAMIQLVQSYESHQSVDDFVRICFYLGATKKRGCSPELLNTFLRRHYNKYLDRVNGLELAIVGTAAYRAAIPLKVNQAKRYEQEILQMPRDENVDWALFNAYIKVLRLSRIRSESVMRKIIEWIQNGSMEGAGFTGITHVFVFFSDNRFVDAVAIDWFCRYAMNTINKASQQLETSPENREHVREKDVRVFLWCMAHLNVNYKLEEKEMDVLIRFVLAKFRAAEIENEDDVVDLAMTLWQLGYANKELFCWIFKEFKAQEFNGSRFKLDTRKYLLLYCVEVEKPDWLEIQGIPKSLDGFRIDRSIKSKFSNKCEELNRVYRAVCEQFPDARFKVVSPIKNLNIAGILVRFSADDIRYIEVLERHTVLSDDTSPIGMVKLKIRLLNKLGFKVDLINSINKTDDELSKQLKRIIGS